MHKLTAATIVIVPPLKQLLGAWKTTESWTGNPAPLLSNVVVPPLPLTTTVKDEIESPAGRDALKV